MDFRLPQAISEDLKRYQAFLGEHLRPHVSQWYEDGAIPRTFFRELGSNGWLGFAANGEGFQEQPALKQAILMESLARLSPGVAVAVAVQISLGIKGLFLFGNEAQTAEHAAPGDSGGDPRVPWQHGAHRRQ